MKEEGIPSRPQAQRQDPVRNMNNGSDMYRELSSEERKDLTENDFMYNLCHLAAFMNRKSFSWDRAQKLILHEENENRLSIHTILAYTLLTVIFSLFIVNLDLYMPF